MNKLKEVVMVMIMVIVALFFMLYLFLGMILQESYKLSPLTETEKAETPLFYEEIER